MELKRYDIYGEYCDNFVVEEDGTGEWVKYRDLLDFLARKGIELEDLD